MNLRKTKINLIRKMQFLKITRDELSSEV